MVIRQTINNMTVYYDMGTSNKSFLDMHYFLKARGIKNDKFFLILYDPSLATVNPRDPNITPTQAAAVLRECRRNFWYFIREVVRIPDQGGTIGGGMQYKLHRGNLALNFGFVRNWNMFLELPRQHGKTISAVCWYLWVYNFGTTNSQIMFINKKHSDSKENLQRLKDIRDALPSYLRMTENLVTKDNKKIRASNTVESVQNAINGNKVRTLASASSKVGAMGLGRGLTMPIHYYDEFGFIKFNQIIRSAATPSFSTASKNARNNHAPYGILFTTTPGDLLTEEGMYAFKVKNKATPFFEYYYDMPDQGLEELIASNNDSSIVYMKFTYQQLGSGEDYLAKMVKDLEGDYDAVRREVLLEWAENAKDCPFSSVDLEKIASYTKSNEEAIVVPICNYYQLYIYEQITDKFYPPIIGVDVSGGYSHDASAITIIDSKTTKVVACLNCNYISVPNLAACIYEIVTKICPTAIVNIERNGGFGASLIATLMQTSIKRNLYFEIKERTIEERYDGIHTNKIKRPVKVYGTDNTQETRKLLMDTLRQRVDHHKDKFGSDIILNEMKGMEYKKNGKIEHSSSTHDDQVFSYLMALYVWYYGKNIQENFGLFKSELKFDSDYEDVVIDDSYNEATMDLTEDVDDPISNQIKEGIKWISGTKTMSMEEWRAKEEAEQQAAIDKILSTKEGRKAMSEATGAAYDNNDPRYNQFIIPSEVFSADGEEKQPNPLKELFDSIQI